jgi:hypothetical protein
VIIVVNVTVPELSKTRASFLRMPRQDTTMRPILLDLALHHAQARLGKAYVQQRLAMARRLEAKHTATLSKSRVKNFAVRSVLQSLGMMERGRTNMADVQIWRHPHKTCLLRRQWAVGLSQTAGKRLASQITEP